LSNVRKAIRPEQYTTAANWPHRTYSSKVLSHNPRGNTNSEYVVQYGDTEAAGGWRGLVVRPLRAAK